MAQTPGFSRGEELNHPLVLGAGRRLFEHDGHLARLRLVSSTPTTTGVILVTYRPGHE